MKLYLQILIIGILVFSSKQQYTCSISGFGSNDGFYNAPTGAGGVCTNTGVCQGYFSETPNSAKSAGTLTGDCFHCSKANRFLDKGQSVQDVRCSRNCYNGYTDSNSGAAESSPLQANCQYCLNGLVNRDGVCECQNKDEYLINSYSGRCGTKCDEGYVQWRDGVHLSEIFTHCVFCHYGLEKQNGGQCACPINGQYLNHNRYGQCGQQCETNFTHYSDGRAPASPITGHCFNCISGHTFYSRKCSTSCPTGEYYTGYNPICGTTCTPGYSDEWFAPPNNPIRRNCGNCQAGLIISSWRKGCHCRIHTQYLTSAASEKCGNTCQTGYTDKSDGSAPNSPTTEHCLFCLAETHELFLGLCYRQCQSGYYHTQNGICGQECPFGYTDKADGSTASSPIEGDCKYCITGLVLKNSQVCRCEIKGQYLTSINSQRCGSTCDNGYTDQQNGGTPSQPLSGHCMYERVCPNGQFLRQIDGNCGIGTCIPGYTDKEDGSTASETITSDCKYCLEGLIKDGTCHCEDRSEFLTSISGGQCGQYCQYPFTYHFTGTPPTPNTPIVGHCLYCQNGFTNINDECLQ